MSYKAVACKLTNVRKHPNADRLKLATVQGYQIIVGLDAEEGTFGAFFPCDGQLVKEHLTVNKLYSTHPDTGEKMGGYFDKNGRVRAQKLRGEISDGFFQEAAGFEWCGGLTIKEGEEFDSLNGFKVCQKYYTPATLKAINSGKVNKKGKKKDKITYELPEHYDTGQLRTHAKKIPNGAVIYVSEKLHGTSGRTGYVKKSTLYASVWKKYWSRFCSFFQKDDYTYVTGTRRTVRKEGTPGYHGSDVFRDEVHKKIKSAGLRKGEILYYEIVGYTEKGKSIMPSHKITDKGLKKRYGDQMSYNYGCNQGEWRFYVYRITETTPDGTIIDLPWNMVISRCKALGLNVVPELDRFMMKNESKEDIPEFLLHIETLTQGDSTLDRNHIKEGVVCRIEHPDVYNRIVNFTEALKYKGFHFCDMEGIKKNDPNYIDMEEIS